MTYDFDKVIDRRNTNSIKWDGVHHLFGDRDVLPMWVADMDFLAPPPVVDALRKQADWGIFGYPMRPASHYDSFIDWVDRRHGWQVKDAWLTYSPGVVAGLSIIILALSQPGDKILVQPPVYYPFYRIIEDNGRRIALNPLRLENGRYRMDFDQLKTIKAEDVRLMILCSPANPVGRVWEREEIQKVGDFCLRNDITLISDEIHSDLIYPGFRHIPTATVSDDVARITVTCMGPSKTFNLAGLQSSVIIIPDERLRHLYNKMLRNLAVGMDNLFGLTAFETAYRHGEGWLTELLHYLHQNLEFTIRYFEKRIPKIKVVKPEGTYLVWLDCRALGLSGEELKDLMTKRAKVGLDDGPIFGQGGQGFQRLNIACPRATLEEGLRRIEEAVNAL